MWFLDFCCEIFTPPTHVYTGRRRRMRTHARTRTHARIYATQIHTCEHTHNKQLWTQRHTTSCFPFWVSCCASVAPSVLKKLDLFHSLEVLFPKYWQNVSWIFPHHGKHSLTMELDKTIESGFSNLFLQYFHTMKRSNISSAVVQWLRGWHVTQYETSALFADLECGVHV